MLQTGQRVGERYEVEALVGQGGLAEVYRVRHVELGSVHALKLLLFRKKALADRLLLEGRIQAQIRHPNVVSVTDVVRHDGQFGLLMEYVDNLSLESLIQRRKALPADEALEVFAPILAGVHAAHKAGVLHRDLKPANVLLARQGGGLVPKVSDFGIAKVVSEGLEGATREGVAMGTPGYMAPEQVLDARSVDARTDVFALGAILYELVAGRRALEDETGEVSVRATLEGTIEPLETVVDGVPVHVSDAVATALARDKDARFATVLDFARALLSASPDLLAQVEGAGASRPISVDPGRPSTYGDPDTLLDPGATERGAALTTPVDLDDPHTGGGPTILPPPTAMPAVDAPGAPDDFEEARRRRRAPPFWTALAITLGVLLFGLSLLVLTVGPGILGIATRDRGEPGPVGVSGVGDGRAGSVQVEVGAVASEASGDVTEPEGDESAEPAPSQTADPGTSSAPRDPAAATGAPTPASVDGGDASTEEGAADAQAEQASDPQADGEAGTGEESDTDAASSAAVAPTQTGEEGTPEDASTDAATTPEPDPDPEVGTAEPTPAPDPVMPMARFLGTSWRGRVFNQPFTLSVLRRSGDDIIAEGSFVLGINQRVVPLVGRFDPLTGRLSFQETDGDLVLEGVASDGAITGLYRRRGKGGPEPLELKRR